MGKIVVKTKSVSRHQLANPFSSDTLHQRLVEKGAIDLRDNKVITHLGNGYCTIQPIDYNKKFK